MWLNRKRFLAFRKRHVYNDIYGRVATSKLNEKSLCVMLLQYVLPHCHGSVRFGPDWTMQSFGVHDVIQGIRRVRHGNGSKNDIRGFHCSRGPVSLRGPHYNRTKCKFMLNKFDTIIN